MKKTFLFIGLLLAAEIFFSGCLGSSDSQSGEEQADQEQKNEPFPDQIGQEPIGPPPEGKTERPLGF